ncbi:hypothetical protein LP420_36215 [Massilia sp. B-10]|nr:hypothetical protein LP420_36215 [Massilia sp. B-10]
MRQLDVDAGDYAHWSGDSGALYFSLGDQLFRRDVKQAFAAPDPDEKRKRTGWPRSSGSRACGSALPPKQRARAAPA